MQASNSFLLALLSFLLALLPASAVVDAVESNSDVRAEWYFIFSIDSSLCDGIGSEQAYPCLFYVVLNLAGNLCRLGNPSLLALAHIESSVSYIAALDTMSLLEG